MSLRPGLCSVTLRALAVDAVARLAGECGLEVLEWGADVHVPPDDPVAARRAVAASGAAGLTIASYGSYLFAAGAVGADEWRPVLDTAAALGAANVRVWAPFGDGTVPAGFVDTLAACAVDAAGAGLTLSLEFHGGTATATVAGTRALLAAVDAPNLFTSWQAPYWRGPTDGAADAAEVAALGDRLAHLHVYEWATADDRRPLAEGAARWAAVLAAAAAVESTFPGPRAALLEFVAGDDPAALRRDAATLLGWR